MRPNIAVAESMKNILTIKFKYSVQVKLVYPCLQVIFYGKYFLQSIDL
jgi:hypothetical protein